MIELRQQHSLAGLLQAAGLSRSTFYYQQKVLQLADNYADVKERIGVIYAQHKGRYELTCCRSRRHRPKLLELFRTLSD